MISQCAEKVWDSMKPEEKYEHIFKCISEICFDYFLSTKTQELLKVNINNTFSQLIDEVVEERNQEIHEKFKEKAEKLFQSNSFLTKRAYTDLVYARFDYTMIIITVL